MKDQVTIFENAQFGRIRTSLTESGEPLFALLTFAKQSMLPIIAM